MKTTRKTDRFRDLEQYFGADASGARNPLFAVEVSTRWATVLAETSAQISELVVFLRSSLKRNKPHILWANINYVSCREVSDLALIASDVARCETL